MQLKCSRPVDEAGFSGHCLVNYYNLFSTKLLRKSVTLNTFISLYKLIPHIDPTHGGLQTYPFNYFLCFFSRRISGSKDNTTDFFEGYDKAVRPGFGNLGVKQLYTIKVSYYSLDIILLFKELKSLLSLSSKRLHIFCHFKVSLVVLIIGTIF